MPAATNRKTIGRSSAASDWRARDGHRQSSQGERSGYRGDLRSRSPPCRQSQGKNFNQAEIYDDYRKLLDRKDVEAVTIGTPDHWHTAIALAALDAGKHVYCEKPLTLTIDEGKQLVAAVKRTGKKFQVGTQQRGDQWELFGRAVATVRSGQLGTIKKVTSICPNSTPEGGPFAAEPVPEGLNWDFWQGQAPAGEYVPRALPLQFSLVVRLLRRHADRLGCAPHPYRAVGPRHGKHRARSRSTAARRCCPASPGGYTTPKSPLVECEYPNGITLDIVAEFEGGDFRGRQGDGFS